MSRIDSPFNRYRRTVAIELQSYLDNPDKEPWSTFLVRMDIKFGAGEIMLERMLKKRHLQVIGDRVVSNE